MARNHHSKSGPESVGGVWTAALARLSRRRREAAIGAVGLAVLGTGSFVLADTMSGDAGTGHRESGAVAQMPSTDAASASGSAAPSITRSVAPTASLDLIRPPARQRGGASPVAEDQLTVTRSGNLKTDGATLQVVSARLDLTGQHELTWVTDEGLPMGYARCTQKFRFSAEAPVVEKPTLLLCWRTSATRSVYTIATVLKGRPSPDASIAAISQRWEELG